MIIRNLVSIHRKELVSDHISMLEQAKGELKLLFIARDEIMTQIKNIENNEARLAFIENNKEDIDFIRNNIEEIVTRISDCKEYYEASGINNTTSFLEESEENIKEVAPCIF